VTVGVAGSGPAADALRAVCADEGVPTAEIVSGAINEVSLAVVIGDESEIFETANEVAIESPDVEWIGVELGTVGGHALSEVEGAVCRFDSGTCFECLRARVAANATRARSGTATDGEAGDGSPNTGGSDGTTRAATARLAGTFAGRMALGVLDGIATPRMIELPYVEREVLPVPGCVCEENRGDHRARFGKLSRTHEGRGLDEALAQAERALDPRVGLIQEVGEAASFPVPYYLATLGDTTAFSDVAASRQAAGVSAAWDEAFMKALGEGLERYAAGVYRTALLPHARPDDIDRTIPPEAFVGSEQMAEPRSDEAIRWVAGEALATGSPVLLPAAVVCFPPPRERVRPAITTGLGLGNSTGEALLSGLYEVLERDAAMLGWYSTFDPLGLTVDSERFATLAGRARSEDLDVSALLLTQDVDVPVVAVAVHRDGEWPRFAVGSGADLDGVRAAEAALAEALQNWTELRAMGPDNAADSAGAIGRYADFPPEARDFLDVKQEIPAASVGTGTDGVEELDAVLDRVRDVGLTPYGVRLTTRDLDELGFEAVRVLIPEAQPLFTDEPYFGERARRVPRESGFEPRLNREPHPYP
jgi:ribosomal protein S12 methylthiotransferase accessory factor